MPINPTLATVINAQVPADTPDESQEITAANINTAITAVGTEIDVVNDALQAQIDALPTVSEMNAAIDAAIDDIDPGSSIELSTPSTFTGAIKFDKLMRTATVNSSDISGDITPDMTGAVDNGGYRLIVVEDGGGEPTLDSDFVAAPNPGTYDSTDGHSTAYVFSNIAGSLIYGIIPLGAAAITPTLSTPSFSADAVSDTQINLTSITYDSDSEGMVIRRATNVGMSANLTTLYTGAPKSSHNDTGLTASTHYYYDIKTTAAGFNDSALATDDDTTDAAGLTPLATPANFTLTADSHNTATAAWDNLTGESGFSVQIATNSGFTTGVQTASKSANVLTHQFTGLTPGTLYYGHVKAIGDGTTTADSAYSTSDSDTTDAAPDVTAPTLVSATVEDANPDRVLLTFSESMNATWSAAAAFGVTGHTVSSVTRTSATTGYLTLSAPFVNGEAARTLSYTQPGSNKMQDLAGNLLANITAASITNNVAPGGDVTAPTVVSRVATGPYTIEVTYSEIVNAASSTGNVFSNGSTLPITGMTGTGTTKLTFTTSTYLTDADTITHTYSGSVIKDAANNQLAAFTTQAVTNSIPALTQIYDHAFTALSPFTKFEQAGGTVSIVSNLLELFCPSASGDAARANHIGALGGLYTPGDILHVRVKDVTLTSGAGIIGIGDVNVAYDWSHALEAGTNTYIIDTSAWGTQGDIVFNVTVMAAPTYLYVGQITVWKE